MEISQVHRTEQGKINTTLSTLHALAQGLGMTMAELIEWLGWPFDLLLSRIHL